MPGAVNEEIDASYWNFVIFGDLTFYLRQMNERLSPCTRNSDCCLGNQGRIRIPENVRIFVSATTATVPDPGNGAGNALTNGRRDDATVPDPGNSPGNALTNERRDDGNSAGSRQLSRQRSDEWASRRLLQIGRAHV